MPHEETKDKSEFPILIGPYLDQKLPGLIPEIFAPEIVSTELHEHSFPSFSLEGDHILWTSYFLDDFGFPSNVISTKIVNGQWTKPEFFKALKFEHSIYPFFSYDGNQIYFTSKSVAIGDELSFGGYDIWYIEKTENGWTTARNAGPEINSEYNELYATLTKGGTLYFLGQIDPQENTRGIYRSEFKNGKYQKAKLLPDNINSEYLDWTPFIAQDESYLLFSSHREGGYGDGDIYISFRKNDETWTDPVNLGPTINGVNSQERFPYVSPDNKYLFFGSNNLDKDLESDSIRNLEYYREKMNNPMNSWNDIYWVDAKIIEDLKPESSNQ
jgi:hypothetical protein